MNRGIIHRNTIWDRLVFQRFHALFGGQLETMTVGSAPVDSEILDFFRAISGAGVCFFYYINQSYF